MPRDIATREIFKVCTKEGLSVERDRLCVYLDVSHLPRELLDRKLAGILEIYEKFQGVDPRTTAMKIFPAVHYSMGGLWCDYERTADGGLAVGSPRNQQTNIPGLFAIGECDYQYHGANRLGANSLVACIFSGLITAPGAAALVENVDGRPAAELPSSLYDREVQRHQAAYKDAARRPQDGENPYRLHQRLGQVMTKAATVVRHNDELDWAYGEVSELEHAPAGVAFRHRQLDQPERGLHPGAAGHVPAGQDDPPRAPGSGTSAAGPTTSRSSPCPRSTPTIRPSAGGRPRPGATGSRRTTASGSSRRSPRWSATDGEPQLSYEEVDTSLIPPRPRLYGVVGGDVIEGVWRQHGARDEAAV